MDMQDIKLEKKIQYTVRQPGKPETFIETDTVRLASLAINYNQQGAFRVLVVTMPVAIKFAVPLATELSMDAVKSIINDDFTGQILRQWQAVVIK
jgi:hypothetical protein